MTRSGLIKRLKKLNIIYKEKLTLRSGKTSDYYCDIKKAIGDPVILAALAEEMKKRIPRWVNVVAGMGHGGISLATAVALSSKKKLTLVRDKKKGHGRQSFIDGHVPVAGDKIVIVDDVVTTGSSIRETIRFLPRFKGKVILAIVAVKRGEGKINVPLRFVFSIDELV